ncbi:MAG: phosphatase PAP2 family protein [Burkholderiaceae bacterium]
MLDRLLGTSMSRRLVRGGVLAALVVAVAACATHPVPPTSTSEVPELRPGSGYLIGYLPRKSLPDSLALLPPPPAPGSPAQAADEAGFDASQALRGSPRWQLAAADADLHFPHAAGTFACALGVTISEGATPHLNMLLRRTLADAGLATYGAKNHYKRVRPFVAHKVGSCAPAGEKRLLKDGSYPSGHAALGWAWALVLAELAPDRADAILKRGHAFGQSRVVCGVHWQSDVDAGRVVGAAAVARLHADRLFRAQMHRARREVAAARASGVLPARDCAAETAVLGKR